MSSISTDLSNIIKKSLDAYFETLNGHAPAVNFYRDILQEAERPIIEKTLSIVDFNQKKAALYLGISRKTLAKKIQTLDISLEKRRP